MDRICSSSSGIYDNGSLVENKKMMPEINTSEGIAMLPNGCTLYWKLNGLGNRVYYSDEIGGGVHVWDTTIVDQSTILAAIVEEQRMLKYERIQHERNGRRDAKMYLSKEDEAEKRRRDGKDLRS
jgi:hypothetical protein